MTIKETKSLELLPRMTTTEKKIYSDLVNNGVSTVGEIANRGILTKGRIPGALERMIERGLIIQFSTEDPANPRYAAVFPIERFVSITDELIESLESRKDELEATTEMVKDFTGYVIKTVRDVSAEERRKQSERSVEDIQDLERILDASFSGILSSVEVDLKDLSKIAQTSIEFLTGSSIRTQETSSNLHKDLVPLTEKFSHVLQNTKKSIQEQLERTVDARVSNVLDFETNANKAFDAVLEAFKDSQNAFEDIIFTILDSGIDDLEKVTRPINDQIEEAINSLKVAIEDASNNFQTEIIRVLTEQKRPIINAIEGLRPKTSKIISEGYKSHNDILSEQFHGLSNALENHTTLFSDSIEQLVVKFNNRITNLINQTQDNLSTADENISSVSEQFIEKITNNFDEKNSVIKNTTNKTQDILNEMMEQFIVILNRSVAEYQLSLGDLIAKLENDFLSNIDNSGAGIQNLVNYINISMTEPVKTLMKNLEQLNEKIDKDEEDFLKRFDESLTKDLLDISKTFQNDSIKSEEELGKDVKRLIDKFDKDISDNHETLTNRLKNSQKNLQVIFKNFSEQHDKELRNTSKEVSSLTKKLERWRGESVDILTRNIDESINRSISILSKEIDEIITKIENTDEWSKDEIISVVKQSNQDIAKSFKGFNNTVNQLIKDSLNDISNTLKKDSLSINNRLAQFKKDQDKLIEETKKPSYKLIDEISNDYNELYRRFLSNIQRFFENEFESFKRGRERIGKSLENTLNRRSTRASKEIISLKEVFERARENYVNKTHERFEDIERTIAKDTSQLIDQEKSTRSTITTLTEKIVADLSNNVNSTAEMLRKSLWDGSEEIFGQAIAEIVKQETQLKSMNEQIKNEQLKQVDDIYSLMKNQLDTFDQKTNNLQEKQIEDVQKFRDQFTLILDEDLNTKLDDIQKTEEDLHAIGDKLTAGIKEVIDVETNRIVREVEVKTSGIEGAIFSTVENITSEASRRTEGVAIIGEQAVRGIEDRYTENLERIRQNLTDEVIGQIEEEAKKIETYKGNLRTIGRDHLQVYGGAVSNINENLKENLKKAEETILKTTAICENLTSRYMDELDEEINAMGRQVGTSTEHFTSEIIDDFGLLLRSVKKEVANFAKTQFELSDKSNAEIAEAFLKSVDDLEEVMLKQFTNYTIRTSNVIEKSKEMSRIVNEHIKDITESINELTE
ncbi:MAG: hypothetical protein FK731_10090 [Asgard group archaeon]|nr:hypothetical protein [Asgard group archaeon]